MKTWTLIATAMLLSACASKNHQRLIVAPSSLFNGENLLRAGVQPENCYRKDLESFTQEARAGFARGSKSAVYWAQVGSCLAWHNELREARFFLGLAQDLAKGKELEALVKNNLALIYLRQNRVTRAYELLSEARTLAPGFVTPSFNLAQLYISQNLNHEALLILNKAPFDKTHDPEVLHLKGLAYLQSAEVKKAGEFLALIPAEMASRADFSLSLAQWHVLEARPDQALNVLDSRQSLTQDGDRLAERLEREARAQITARETKK